MYQTILLGLRALAIVVFPLISKYLLRDYTALTVAASASSTPNIPP
jgi:hypothetical protein